MITPPSTYLAQWCLIVLIKSVLVLPAALIIPMRSCQTINFFSFNYDKPPFCCGFEPSSHAYLIKIASPLGIPFFTVRNKNTLFFFIGMAFIPLPPTFGGRAIRKYFFCGFPNGDKNSSCWPLQTIFFFFVEIMLHFANWMTGSVASSCNPATRKSDIGLIWGKGF